MRKDTHTKIIIGRDFSAIISGVPDKCKHDDLGSTVFQTASGKTITWKTYKEWASYTSQMRDPLIMKRQEELMDPIVQAGCSCSKCGKAWEPDIYNMP